MLCFPCLRVTFPIFECLIHIICCLGWTVNGRDTDVVFLFFALGSEVFSVWIPLHQSVIFKPGSNESSRSSSSKIQRSIYLPNNLLGYQNSQVCHQGRTHACDSIISASCHPPWLCAQACMHKLIGASAVSPTLVMKMKNCLYIYIYIIYLVYVSIVFPVEQHD